MLCNGCFVDMDDNLSINEFAELSGVDASTLRFWDRIGIFSPTKRNPDTNYRYYSMVQLLTLNFVTTLSDLQIPLKTIAKLREDRDPQLLLDLLESQEEKMDMEMRELRLRYSIIHARRKLINHGVNANETEISIRHAASEEMILWSRNEYQEGDTFIKPLADKIVQIGERHINLSFPVGGYHDNIESFLSSPGCPDHFLSIDPLGTHTREAGDYVTGYARGFYGELTDLSERMAAYIEENSVAVSGPVYTLYLRDEICTQDPSQYLAQCSVAVS